ncbi:MAG TPA: hypothetical protein VK436_04480 [Methanocella sp.]|nr:hypothetical protein [Methanocella sp.]
MLGRFVSVMIAGAAGSVAIVLMIPILMLLSLTGLIPTDRLPDITSIMERSWILIAIPIVLFLTGAAAAHLSRGLLNGLIDCSIVSISAGVVAIPPGIVMLVRYFDAFSHPLVISFLVVLLLAAVSGSFVQYYFFSIRPASMKTFASLNRP